MSDAKTRYDLFEFVSAQWGADRAAQLMDLLPPAGASELVTRDHLAVTQAEIRCEMAAQGERLSLAIAAQGERFSRELRQVLIANVAMWVSTVVAVAVVG